MNKMVQAASVIALAVAASSAGAWYGAPNQAGCMTDQQQQAAADQQRAFEQQQQAFLEQRQAMAAQRAKAAEQAMATRRQFAEQQAARFKDAPQPAPAMDPRLGNVAAPAWGGPAFPARPEPRRFERPAMPEFAMPEMPRAPDFKAPEFPAMPEMPAFERPAMPEMPAFERPAMPEFAMPEMPAFVGNRGPALDAHRAQARQDMAARRNAMKEQSDRRRAAHGFGPRPVGPGAGMGCAPVAAPQAAAPAAANQTTVAAVPTNQ
jgi:hypothetical protein